MELIFSKIKPEKLLHIIHNSDDFHSINNGNSREVVDEKESIQLAALKMNKGHTFRPPYPSLIMIIDFNFVNYLMNSMICLSQNKYNIS